MLQVRQDADSEGEIIAASHGNDAQGRLTASVEPGTRQAYHAISLGFYEGELLCRVDTKHRSLGRLFQDQIAAPLGLFRHWNVTGDPLDKFSRQQRHRLRVSLAWVDLRFG